MLFLQDYSNYVNSGWFGEEALKIKI